MRGTGEGMEEGGGKVVEGRGRREEGRRVGTGAAAAVGDAG